MAHTPAPWQAAYAGGRDWLIYGPGADKVVADLNFWEDDSYSEEVTYDNARLIAKAPEMYELLKELEFCDCRVSSCYCPICGGLSTETEKKRHEPDCRLSAVLKAVEGGG